MFKYALSLAFASSLTATPTIGVSLQSDPRVQVDDSSAVDMKSVGEFALAPLSLSALASVSAAGGTGQVFQNTSISFLNQNNGTINYDDGWSFVNVPNEVAVVSNNHDLRSFYQFNLDNPGSVTVNWSSSSFGSNLFGIGGILVTFDLPPQVGNIFGTDRSGSGSFTKELTAGTHTITFLDLSNMGGGTGQPESGDAHLHETLMFSITGTVEPPSPIPEPAAWSLLAVGSMFLLAVAMTRRIDGTEK
jgi:hypothetical protein